jgi:hypothetical protein
MTQADYLRLMHGGPDGLRESLWLYLYQEGLISVPWSWQFAFLCTAFGTVLLPFIDHAHGILFRILWPKWTGGVE